MTALNRRAVLQMLTAAPIAALVWTDTDAEAAAQAAGAARQAAQRSATAYQPKFFTPHQWATVTLLGDLIIPKDDRSGSASDAGVPEFMDFMMTDQPRRKVAMRGGLALVDRLAESRFGKRFAAASDAQRRQLLDEIAYTSNPDRALQPAIAFFSSFRDLTASGFWSSKIGVADLQYQGNAFVDEWNGCPTAALTKLGVRYV